MSRTIRSYYDFATLPTRLHPFAKRMVWLRQRFGDIVHDSDADDLLEYAQAERDPITRAMYTVIVKRAYRLQSFALPKVITETTPAELKLEEFI